MSEPDPDAQASEQSPARGEVRPEPDALRPLDVDGVGAVAFGTLAWTVALVLCLVLRTPLADAGRGWWLWVCVAGAVLGVAGLWFVRRRRDAYAAARSH